MTFNRTLEHEEIPWNYYLCVFGPERGGVLKIENNNGKRYGRVQTHLPGNPLDLDRELLLKMYASAKEEGEKHCRKYRHLRRITTVGFPPTGQVRSFAE